MQNNKAEIQKIDALLPQTQCQECGYGGCLPYATAIVEKNENINRCPPGGMITQHALSKLTGKPIQPLINAEISENPKQVARIQEDLCIGCTLCIKACPVDAIVGANKMMHTIIENECTGCGLCLPPCPMDCIVMEAHPTQTQTWALENEAALQRANHARKRHYNRAARLAQEAETQKQTIKPATDFKSLLQQALDRTKASS